MKLNHIGRCAVAPILTVLSLLIAACGGSSSSAPRAPASVPAPAPTTPPPSGPTWTPGVYASSATFKDQCAAPRSGVDIDGNPFPDRLGSTTIENFWLRSWTNETYLWNDEVTDRNPADFNDRVAYFELLKTEQTTASGKPKDDFHFSEPTADFLARRNSAPAADYGARYIVASTTVPRDYRIAYTDPGTPASTEVAGLANFVRGARILEIDGVDLVNATSAAEVEILNDGLFPRTAGEMHSFVVEDPGAAPRTVVLTSANLSRKPVNMTKVITTPSGPVGYVLINTLSPFASEMEIADAIESLDTPGVSDLILDLRYNGGGLLAVASQLGFMIAGSSQTSGKTYEALRFNADAGAFNPVTGAPNTPLPFIDTGVGFSVPDGDPLPSLDLGRVFILATENTCSASESIVNSLRGIDVEVILIGSATCGKPFGFFPQDNCGETYYTIQFQGVNDKGFGDYADGFHPANTSASFGVFVPGCAVDDDLVTELGDETEAMLAAALQYRDSGTCPTPTGPSASSSSGITVSSVSAGTTPAMRMPSSGDIFETNRDMTGIE
ncbi:MAG: peptidase [Marinicaulis sp.]|nr:peptidase [Marinicaulis sp.]NNL89487.1 peptidase [Marinicaulis sp.]